MSFLIRSGVQTIATDGLTSLVIAGQKKLVTASKENGLFVETLKNYDIDSKNWEQAVARLPSKSGKLPLKYDLAHVISFSDTVSRYNSPSNAISLFKELNKHSYPEDVDNIHIILLSEYDHVVPTVSAIARCFPLFSLKSSQGKDKNVLVDVVLPDGKELQDDDVKYLNNLTDGIRNAGRLVDTPANILTTNKLVEEAASVASETGATMTLIQGEDLLERGFGGIYHVGKAGPTPPAFVVLSNNVSDTEDIVALVGKGVVYDTGGLQIKSKTGMPNMKRDMGGAAAVLETFQTLVKSGYSKSLHACLCIVENNVSPIANKPDDVITMLSGKTVEINNTDAEGRLILADGVHYAKNVLKATTIVDIATLTGAQSYVSGKLHAAVMSNDEQLERELLDAGKRSGDLVAPLIFAPELFFSDLSSAIADMKNSNLGKMQGPPSAIAGLFIGAHIDFGNGLKWAHIDIAAPAEYGDRGTGYGVALLTTLLGADARVPLFKSDLIENQQF